MFTVLRQASPVFGFCRALGPSIVKIVGILTVAIERNDPVTRVVLLNLDLYPVFNLRICGLTEVMTFHFPTRILSSLVLELQ